MIDHTCRCTEDYLRTRWRDQSYLNARTCAKTTWLASR